MRLSDFWEFHVPGAGKGAAGGLRAILRRIRRLFSKNIQRVEGVPVEIHSYPPGVTYYPEGSLTWKEAGGMTAATGVAGAAVGGVNVGMMALGENGSAKSERVWAQTAAEPRFDQPVICYGPDGEFRMDIEEPVYDQSYEDQEECGTDCGFGKVRVKAWKLKHRVSKRNHSIGRKAVKILTKHKSHK